MQEIADWFKKLGMSEYTQRFAEDRIDFSVLPELTDQHLKDLGVALGDRLKMLAAIRELGISIPASTHPAETGPTSQDTANPPLPSIPAAATPLSISAAAKAAGERRYLTVMFCDLVDFDRDFGAPGRRGLGRPAPRLSRRGCGGGEGAGRPCRQESR